MLLDLFMFNLDGYNIIKNLCSILNCKNFLIVVISVNKNKEIICKWVIFGLIVYIIKFFIKFFLLKVVDKVLL